MIQRVCNIHPILILAGTCADASGDKSADKYSEMSAIVGFLGPPNTQAQVLSLSIHQMAALTALTDGILDMVGTESFLGSIFFGVDKFFIEIFFFFLFFWTKHF